MTAGAESQTYRIREKSGATGLAAAAEQIRLVGYAVVESGFPPAFLTECAQRIDDVIARQAEEIGGESVLAAIGDSQIARCLVAYDDFFLQVLTATPVLEMCHELLGEYFVAMQQNALISKSDTRYSQARFHRDLPYQHFVSSRPIAISALLCLEPPTRSNGGTVVLPASHRMEAFPAADVVAALETTVSAPAGSFIVFDSMLFHRGGQNETPHARRIVNQVYSLPFVAQQISIASALAGRYAEDPFLHRLLGYDTDPARSVREWRLRRLQRESSGQAIES